MAKASSTFNLSSLDTIAACNRPVEIQIKDTNGVPTPFFISIVGKDSDVYRGRVRALADDQIQKQAMGKRSGETIDKLEAKNIDALVAATTGWRLGDGNVVELGDEQLEFSAANVRRVYAGLLPVREQVSEAINDLANFMPA